MQPPRSSQQHSSLEQSEQQVAAEIARLAATDRISARDLERFRRSLPTDPMLAAVISKAIPWTLNELFEYVEGSNRQTAYWRVSPQRSEARSAADRKHKERFAAAARAAEGVSGTEDYKGKEIPSSAANVAEQIAEKPTKQSSQRHTNERALDRLRELLKA